MLTELRIRPDSALSKRVKLSPGEDGRIVIPIKPGINLLIGPNGSGKSSIMKSLCNRTGGESKDIAAVTSERTVFTFFDTETMNPKMATHFGESFSEIAYQATARWRSHGEVLGPVVADAFVKPPKERTIVVLDEPEAGADHDVMQKLVAAMKKACSQKRKLPVQALIATHYVPLWLIESNHILLGPLDYKERVLADYRKAFHEDPRRG